MSWNNDGNDHADTLTLILGAVVGAALVGLVWITLSVVTPSDGSGSSDSLVTSTDGASGEPSARGASQAPTQTESSENEFSPTDQATYLDRCREVYDAQGAPLRAIGAPLDQWQVHIGAMNKLVVGAITLDQAMQFWNQTRVGAHTKLEDFQKARVLYGQRTVRCPTPGTLPHVEPGLGACQQAVAARARAMRTGTTALGTWRMHVHHMDMLRSGEMTPEEATRLWLASWRLGVRQVHEFKVAAQQARGVSCP